MEQKTIFLVDDNHTNLMAGKKALEEHYDVLTLNSGAKLLNMLEKMTPDLILLDIEMPEMNGYDTLKAIKANAATATIPVIFLTAKTDGESELTGLRLGAVDYITKPFSAPLLLKHLEIHLLIETQRKELLAQKQKLVNFNNNLQSMVDEKTNSILELQSAILSTVAELVECRDDTTGGHIERTTAYLGILLMAMRERGEYSDTVASWDIEMMMQAAQLHDVGKVAISDSVLRKPGKLTPEEFDEIKKHTSFGEEVINKIKMKTSERAFLMQAGVFAGTHHEKWDGSGYHRGLKGEEIPLEGRIMAIADVYDALVSHRPYKKPFTHEEAVKIIMEGKGTHFDPALADLFYEVADEFNEVHIDLDKTGG